MRPKKVVKNTTCQKNIKMAECRYFVEDDEDNAGNNTGTATPDPELPEEFRKSMEFF